MNRGTQQGHPAANGAPLPTNTIASARQATEIEHEGIAIPGALSLAFPPAGRRTEWLLLVASCPLCGSTHAHRSPSPTGEVRASGCRRGSYRLFPVVGVIA